MSQAWTIDERAYAGHEHLDPGFVAAYDRKQGSIPDEAAAADVATLRRHGLGDGATVVDLGAGTGRFAVAAAAQVGAVVAVDPSAAMLAVARERVRAAGRSNVTFVQAGFCSYEHAGPAADAVHTRNALHQLPDLWKAVALSRAAALLRPGGLLLLRDLVLDCAPGEFDRVVADWLDGAVDDPARGYTREDLAEHLRTEHSTFRWLLEPMLEQAGFEVVDVAYRRRVYAAYVCVRR